MYLAKQKSSKVCFNTEMTESIIKRFFIGIFIILILFSSISQASAQCSMCRATVENSLKGNEGKAGSGLNAGILYLLSLPYIIFVVIGYFWYRSSKNRRVFERKIKTSRNLTL